MIGLRADCGYVIPLSGIEDDDMFFTNPHDGVFHALSRCVLVRDGQVVLTTSWLGIEGPVYLRPGDGVHFGKAVDMRE